MERWRFRKNQKCVKCGMYGVLYVFSGNTPKEQYCKGCFEDDEWVGVGILEHTGRKPVNNGSASKTKSKI
jgi:hypothetical protein